MLWLLRAMVFTGYFAVAVLVVLGGADLAARRWQRAVGEGLAATLGLCAGVVLVRSAGSLFAGAYADPGEQFRLLLDIGRTLLNWSVLGFVAGGVAGVLLAMRRRRLESAGAN